MRQNSVLSVPLCFGAFDAWAIKHVGSGRVVGHHFVIVGLLFRVSLDGPPRPASPLRTASVSRAFAPRPKSSINRVEDSIVDWTGSSENDKSFVGD